MRLRTAVQPLLQVLCIAAAVWGSPAGAADPEMERAQQLWSRSPHGKMLERILPPSTTPRELPDPDSPGARLTLRYCVQCHYLPHPHMHTAARWQSVVERMVWRMEGRGNMGMLMKEMMAEVRAPDTSEVATLIGYLKRHAQKEIEPNHPALAGETGRMFSIACSQCHALPDPQRHTAREWPAVVKRMTKHMAWSNRVVGDTSLRTTPVLDTARIVGLLQRYARPERQ